VHRKGLECYRKVPMKEIKFHEEDDKMRIENSGEVEEKTKSRIEEIQAQEEAKNQERQTTHESSGKKLDENTSIQEGNEKQGKNSDASDGGSDKRSGETESEKDSSDHKEKLEDLSWDKIHEMLESKEGTDQLTSMNADFRERYEAEMRGMSQEEYQAYKTALAKADQVEEGKDPSVEEQKHVEAEKSTQFEDPQRSDAGKENTRGEKLDRMDVIDNETPRECGENDEQQKSTDLDALSRIDDEPASGEIKHEEPTRMEPVQEDVEPAKEDRQEERAEGDPERESERESETAGEAKQEERAEGDPERESERESETAGEAKQAERVETEPERESERESETAGEAKQAERAEADPERESERESETAGEAKQAERVENDQVEEQQQKEMEYTDSADSTEHLKEDMQDVATKRENKGERSEDLTEENKEERFEDLTYDRVQELASTPDGIEELNRMNADFRERYEAEMRGMTQEEYQDYKKAYSETQQGKELEGGCEESEQSEAFAIRKKADDVLEKSDVLCQISEEQYLNHASKTKLCEAMDQNTACIAELKDIRNEVSAEKSAAWDEIAKMNYDGTKEMHADRYRELCDKYYQYEQLEDRLDYATVKTDMKNWDLAQATGNEYKCEYRKADASEIQTTCEKAEKLLSDGVANRSEIMDAYRLGKKMENDILPSLTGDMKELVTRLLGAKEQCADYLSKHNCTHEEALADRHYALQDRYVKSLECEGDRLAKQIIDVERIASDLRGRLPVTESDYTLKVTENKNGTITLEKKWDNDGSRRNKQEGGKHLSDVSVYKNAYERKETFTIGQYSDFVYAHKFSFQYRGLGFMREDIWGGDHVKLKNKVEGGFLNYDRTVGYQRAMGNEKPSVNVKIAASIARLKDEASLLVRDKEYRGLSVETSLLKSSVNGTAVGADNAMRIPMIRGSVSAASHIVGAEAAASAGDIQIAKANIGIGSAKAVASTSFLNTMTSAQIGDYECKTTVSVWNGLRPESESKGDLNEIRSSASGTIGNQTKIAEWKTKDLNQTPTRSDIIEKAKKIFTQDPDSVMQGRMELLDTVIKDAEAAEEVIRKGGIGKDIAKSPTVIGNADIEKHKN